MDRSMVWGLRLLFLGVDVVLPWPIISCVLVGRSSAAVYQQLAPAECGGSFSVVPFSMACGTFNFPLFILLYRLLRYMRKDARCLKFPSSHRPEEARCPSVALSQTSSLKRFTVGLAFEALLFTVLHSGKQAVHSLPSRQGTI